MNQGLDIFKQAQHLAGGEEDVPLAGRAARKVQDLSISALQNLPEWLKSPIRHGVGRVVSNTLVPMSYEVEDTDAKSSQLAAMAELFAPKKLGHTLSSLAKDQPAYGTDDLSYFGEEGARAGRPLLREYFDLPTQDDEWMYSHRGKQYRLNPGNKNEAISDAYKKFQQDSLEKLQGKKPEFRYEFLGGNYLQGHDDPWNFDVPPAELERLKGRPLPVQYYGRQLLEAMGHPAVLETGGYPPEPFFANPDPEDDDVKPWKNSGGGYARGTGNVQHLAEGTTSLNYDPSYPGPVNPKGGGSGVPTQQWAGRGIGTASNFLFPGLGLLTGPLASWATRMLQSGLSQNQVQRAVQNYQSGGGQSGDTIPAPVDDGSNVTAPTTDTPPSAGIGIDPFGNPADPGEFWSSDFGRWGEGDAHGTTPGNYNPSGPGGISGTRGVWGGQTTIPIASDPNFTPSLGWAMPAASGGGAYGGNTMAKIAMHGTFKDIATPEQWAFMQNYLQGGQGGGGSGAGVGGAGRPMTQSRQMGDSDVNPGLKLFHAKQLKRKNKIK